MLVEAEELAAQLWDADWARFSVGGSSHGNQALALAVGQPGDEVVVTRAVHRSLLVGFVLAGLRPVWVPPPVDPVTGLPGRLPVDQVRAALAAHPDARAVFAVEPGYAGTRSDVAGLAAAAHDAGVPLVVDQAWSRALRLPSAAAPARARRRRRRDGHQCAQGPAGLHPGRLALATTQRLDRDRLQRGFDATHTTSPAGPILASIDAARRLLATDGERLLGLAIDAVAGARQRLGEVDGLAVLAGPPDEADPLRLVVGLAGTGADGFVVEDDLLRAGFGLEMADRDTLVATVTMADDATTVEPLVDAIVASVRARRTRPREVPPAAWLGTDLPEVAMPPREAFFSVHETVPAAGRRRTRRRRAGGAVPAGDPRHRPRRGRRRRGGRRAARGSRRGRAGGLRRGPHHGHRPGRRPPLTPTVNLRWSTRALLRDLTASVRLTGVSARPPARTGARCGRRTPAAGGRSSSSGPRSSRATARSSPAAGRARTAP